MDERKSFEHWFSDEGKFPKAVERNLDGGYRLAQAASAWTAWQARAAIEGSEVPAPAAPEAPKPDTLDLEAVNFAMRVGWGFTSSEACEAWGRIRAALGVEGSEAPAPVARPMKPGDLPDYDKGRDPMGFFNG